MGKQVINYKIVERINKYGDIRIGYIPIFRDLGPKENTTLESNLPAAIPLGIDGGLWRHRNANGAKERK